MMEYRAEASLQSATQAAQALSGTLYLVLRLVTYALWLFQKLQRLTCRRGKRAGSSCRTSQSLCELAKASVKNFAIPPPLAMD
jgi:flagellar biogenesis protein FliO